MYLYVDISIDKSKIDITITLIKNLIFLNMVSNIQMSLLKKNK